MSEVSRIEQIFLNAVNLPDLAERGAYLDSQCGTDADLRRRVEALLAAQPQAQGFLEPVTVDRTSEYQTKPESQAVGTVIADRYTLTEVIGEGGMGTVWRAKQTEPVKRFVALKLIKPGMDSKQVLARFEAERQALAMMDHPNIAKILDGGIHDNRPFFVMELVKGTPITEFCDARKLTPRQRLELFLPVCLAIQHAHQKGIIHRDIKPSNVLIALYDDKPVPKVIDFGVAKATGGALTQHTIDTGFGGIVGTPQYMSPEQATFNNLDIDTRSDVYSLGTLLYELLAGSPPFARPELEKRGLLEILRVVREEEPPRPSLKLSTAEAKASISANRSSEPAKLSDLMRGEIDWIVMKALEKDRTRRYDTANGLAADVQRYLNGDAVEACPPTLGYRLRKAYKRNKTAVRVTIGFAFSIIAILGLVVYGVWWTDRERRERQYEQELVSIRENDAIASLLEQSEAALKVGRLAEASTLLRQANERTNDFTPSELRQRYGQVRKDEQALLTLEDIFEERWKIARSDTNLDNTRAKLRYPALFQNYGFAIGKESPSQTIEKIRLSLIPDSLASGLMEWFFVDPKLPGLLEILDALDPNPTRKSVREVVFSGDVERLSELQKEIDVSQLTPTYAMGMGGEKIMKEVWKHYPDSFPLALSLSRNSNGEMEKAVTWARVAVALRPSNALSHYQLARAFDLINASYSKAEDDPAIEELERTIQLAPQFARAHSKLAILLLGRTRGGRKQDDAAFALAERALGLDNKDSLANAVLMQYHFSRKDYLRAARAANKIEGNSFDPTHGYDGAYEQGMIAVLGPLLVEKLIKTDLAYEAYQVIRTWNLQSSNSPLAIESDEFLNPVKAAALAGTGQGTDAPPVNERPAIRKHALEWLTKQFEDCKRASNPLPDILAGVIGQNAAQSSSTFLDAAILTFYFEAASAHQKDAAHARMIRWLGDPHLASIRDAEWLAKLSIDEQANWGGLWAQIRTLRDLR